MKSMSIKKLINFILIIIIIVITSGCKNKAMMISDCESFEKLFSESIKYDIRSEELCEKGHIPNFMCMGGKDNKTLAHNIDIIATNKDKKIILIGDETDVLEIFSILSDEGYKNLFYFEGGYDGYASKKGDSFIPESGCGC